MNNPNKKRLRRTMMFLNAQKPGLIKDPYIYKADSLMLDLEELQELLATPAALPDLTGCKINHKMFGAGTVRPAEGQFMVIDFNGTLKKFSYTASMNSGYLSAEDPNVEARLQAYQDYNKDKDRLEKELKNLKAELVKL